MKVHLQTGAKSWSFVKKKSTNWVGAEMTKETYGDAKKELEELEKASRSIGIGA